MGSFVFKWDHPGSEVYVTGTFDDWKKTEKLEKVGDSFKKEVALPDISSKIFYKFVVDGDWVTDPTAPKEVDESGIDNNVLTPERIVSEAPATAAIMSSAAPESTTAELAAKVPLQKKDEEEKKGVNDVKDDVKDEHSGEKEDAKDEPTDLPGTFPETPAVEQNSGDTYGVNPLPATAGAVNPIKLAPGEGIPKELTADGTTSNVRLDPESYEKSDTLPGGAPFSISSAAPESTTAALAAGVPIEHKVPEIVKESQEQAHYDPEASAVPSEVEEKAAVEKELLEKVKEAPSTAEGTADKGTATTGDVVGLAGAGADKTSDATGAQEPTSEASKSPEEPAKTNAVDGEPSKEARPEVAANGSPVSYGVPAIVQESIAESGVSPEGTTNPEAVEEKSAVEAELLKEVKPVEEAKPAETGEESPKGTSVATGAPAATEAPEIKETPVLAVPATTTAPTTSVAASTTETPAIAAAAEPRGSDTTTEPVAAGTTTPPAAEASKPAEQKTATNGAKDGADGATNGEKKKKHRLSAIFGKVKAKLTHKN